MAPPMRAARGAPLGGGDFILHAPDQAMRATSLSRPISSSLIMPRSMYSRVSGTPAVAMGGLPGWPGFCAAHGAFYSKHRLSRRSAIV